MESRKRPSLCVPCTLLAAALGLQVLTVGNADTVPNSPAEFKSEYGRVIQPLMQKYCLGCHSTKVKKGSLDLERFTSLDQVRKDLKPWQQAIEMLEAGEMPPKLKAQPTSDERKVIIAWIRGFLDEEARARAGDPGYVPLRRLSNSEYDYTIRDLTGVDLHPTKEFPADGAAGEGFTNAAEALTDISPTLLAKYFSAAKDVAEHAVLLPEGFAFSPSKTRRDWTNESLARLRAFYSKYTADGRLSLQPYLLATVRHRESLTSDKETLEEVAAKEKVNPKCLRILWQTLNDKTPSYPLDAIRAHWREAALKDVGSLEAEITAWQTALWQFVPIGSYRFGNSDRQVANNPEARDSLSVKIAVKPEAGQSDVVLYLVTRNMTPEGESNYAVWHRPRFEGAGKQPLLLHDYAQFGHAYEIDFPKVFSQSSKYLAAIAEAAHDQKSSVEDLAKKHGLESEFLKRWIEVVNLEPLEKEAGDAEKLGKRVPLNPLELFNEQAKQIGNKAAINGWRRTGEELPILLSNSSNGVEQIPGKVSPHKVVVHPASKEFVAATWKSPITGKVQIAARVAHVHPDCGNGVAWWLELRRANRAYVLSEGLIDRGGDAKSPHKVLPIEKGDQLVLAVDARDGDYVCDLTEINIAIAEIERPRPAPGRSWDLAEDVADSILTGNPHSDRHGNKEVWSFAKGSSKPSGKTKSPGIPPNSVLGRWRAAASDLGRQHEATLLAERVQALLAGPRPAKDKDPDRDLFDFLVSVQSDLFKGLDPSQLGNFQSGTATFGLAKEQFGKDAMGRPTEEASLVVAANSVTKVRLPAALFRDRQFVVEGRVNGPPGDRIVWFQVLTSPPTANFRWDGMSPVVGSPTSAAYKQLIQGCNDFRRSFPWYLCFPNVVPVDEVVSLKMFHREDEPLARLMLDDDQNRRLDRLWSEHRFISQQPVAENKYLPQFIGFVTQDQPKELLAYYEGQRANFQKRAEVFEKDMEAAIPKQLTMLVDFAGRAYRRPLQEKEKTDLLGLYDIFRKKGAAHDEAFRSVLARILVSPAFLFRIEKAPPGKKPGLVNDWELATRLSYFLWSSGPDDTLRQLAAEGRLREPNVLVEQVLRMVKDDRVRALAIEFGAQWLHVRGFDELKEKNEKLFPTFDAELRKAINEESILFFKDLFQADRAVTSILDADYTFLNELLAKHYGIPGVTGPEWRRVQGIRKYGRGGILGLASVQASQSGASRTSPVLRGNWLVETLLGEKLPRPPANVPKLPEEEGGPEKLTMRQLVEKHTRIAECAVCHVRIDAFGFALERYDPIGRRRDKDLGGLAVDAHAKLKDGVEFDDIDGLRNYLMTTKKDVIVKLFCRKLLGYALGRAVTLSDQSLVDEMMAQLNKNNGQLSAAILTIVNSQQFRMIRGSDFTGEN